MGTVYQLRAPTFRVTDRNGDTIHEMLLANPKDTQAKRRHAIALAIEAGGQVFVVDEHGFLRCLFRSAA